MVVAMELTGIVMLEGAGEFVEELEELGGGLVGEFGGQRHQRGVFVVHDRCSEVD
jgi:hypothetical protein